MELTLFLFRVASSKIHQRIFFQALKVFKLFNESLKLMCFEGLNKVKRFII